MGRLGLMIDLDGTIYKGSRPIDGAKSFIEFLKAEGIPFVFLTNNSSHAREFYLRKLNGMGFDVGIENILTSTVATIRYIQREFPNKRIFASATEDVKREMALEGLNMVEEAPDVALLTFDRKITYDKINKMYRSLMEGVAFVATHPDDLCPTEDSYDIDIGPFIRMFEGMTGRKAIVIGKPNPLMLEMACLEMGIEPKDAVMVGDRLYTDIKMAHDGGIRSILVLTGETKMDDLNGSAIKPTMAIESVASIPSILDSLN